jgi:hypothetical protein
MQRPTPKTWVEWAKTLGMTRRNSVWMCAPSPVPAEPPAEREPSSPQVCVAFPHQKYGNHPIHKDPTHDVD